MKNNLLGGILASVVLAMGLGLSAHAGEATAFELVKAGNHYLSDEAKDKVVQIRSEKSVGTMAPTIWYIVYYDPDATFRATEVKFGAGQKLEVKRPTRMIEFGTEAAKKLDPDKLKVDSDKALAIAMKEPLLANLKLKASQLWLEHGDEGPTWKVRLWAAKLSNPNADADIGDVYITSADGKVVRRDLHINRVD